MLRAESGSRRNKITIRAPINIAIKVQKIVRYDRVRRILRLATADPTTVSIPHAKQLLENCAQNRESQRHTHTPPPAAANSLYLIILKIFLKFYYSHRVSTFRLVLLKLP